MRGNSLARSAYQKSGIGHGINGVVEMPHQAGEGYSAIKVWVLDNYDEILAGDLPFDFGNWTAQGAADDLLAQLGEESGAFTPEEAEEVRNLPPEAFPEHVEPSSFAQSTMKTFSDIYNTIKEAGQKFISGLKSLFGM